MVEWSDGLGEQSSTGTALGLGLGVSWRAVALLRYWCKMMAFHCIGVGAICSTTVWEPRWMDVALTAVHVLGGGQGDPVASVSCSSMRMAIAGSVGIESPVLSSFVVGTLVNRWGW